VSFDNREALETVLGAAVPACLSCLEVDDVELRELTYGLLSAAAGTSPGWALLAEGAVRVQLDEILLARDVALRSLRQPEENDLSEMKLIKDLRRTLAAPRVASTAGAMIVSPVVSRASSRQDEPLLLGPPSV